MLRPLVPIVEPRPALRTSVVGGHLKHFVLALWLGFAWTAFAQQPAVPGASDKARADTTVMVIGGAVKSGSLPIPGVTVVASDGGGHRIVTSTDAEGNFSAVLPEKGRWTVSTEMAGFAPVTREIEVEEAKPHPRIELQLVLLSRVPAQQSHSQQTASATRGRQRVGLLADEANLASADTAGTTPLPGMPALGASGEAATESLAINGATGSGTEYGGNLDDLRSRVQEMQAAGQNSPNGLSPQFGGQLSGGSGLPGGGGGGRGGFGGRRPGFNSNQPHGSLFFSFGDSALNAAPYSLSGAPAVNPPYSSSRYGGTIGGPLKIPKVFKGDEKTFYFVNFFGNRASTPYDSFSHVPTALERAGNFSQTDYTSGPNAGMPVQIFNPATGLPFAGGIIPGTMINPASST
ncbi:MAG: carboxypeptidase-like regulatory domain-containing protein, partial [Terriglobales bacterium]